MVPKDLNNFSVELLFFSDVYEICCVYLKWKCKNTIQVHHFANEPCEELINLEFCVAFVISEFVVIV